MESVKKLLPFLLVAIVFAVGGYFIGKGNLDDQGAALYRATDIKVDPAGVVVYQANWGKWCWQVLGNGKTRYRTGPCRELRTDNGGVLPVSSLNWGSTTPTDAPTTATQ